MTFSCGKEIDLRESIWNCSRDGYHLAKYGSPSEVHEVRGGPQGINFGSVRANGWEEMGRRVDAHRANLFVDDAEGIILHSLACWNTWVVIIAKKGHIACRCLDHNRGQSREYSVQQKSGKLHQLEDVVNVFSAVAGEERDEYYLLFCVNSNGGHNLYKVTVLANGVYVTKEINRIVDEKTFHYLSSQVTCWNSTLWMLPCVPREGIPVAAKCKLEVQNSGNNITLRYKRWPL